MLASFSTVIEQFECDNQLNIGPRWNDWATRLDELFVASDTKDDEQKRATLFLLGGTKLRKIHNSIPDKDEPEEGEKYRHAIKKLTDYFNPKRNRVIEIYKFRQAKQLSQENIEQYVTRLRLLSTYCEFPEVDDEIIGQVIQSCFSANFRRKLLRTPDLDIEELLQLGRINDTVEEQAKIVEGVAENFSSNEEINMINSNKNRLHKFETRRKYFGKDKTDKKCFKCGLRYPHEGSCPAIGKKCRKCHQLGHYAIVCKDHSRNSIRNDDHKKNWNKNYVNIMQDKIIEQEQKWAAEEKQYIFTLTTDSRMPSVDLEINGKLTNFKIDSCATINILDEDGFYLLSPLPKLLPYYNPTYAYNADKPLETLGQFQATISYKGEVYQVNFVVMKGKGGNILSFQTSKKLKLIQILNSIDVKVSQETLLDKWKKKFPSVFSEKIGKMKKFQLKLHINEDIKPVQAKPRNKPFHLREAIDEQIQNMLDQDIIEAVTNEPTEWLSETVEEVKPESKQIRICVDMKAANRAIQRERYEMPNIENIMYKANEMKIFNKIDLKAAFQQIELHPSCRYISKFRTHKGIFQFKRLFFGVSSAPEIFHNIIRKLLEGVDAAINATDDILVMGKTEAESEENVEKVLSILSEAGLTVNSLKCKFNQKEITFFGLILSEKGVSLNEQKVQAIKAFKTPQNASELHSFLGLTVYASRWIPDLATLTKPLWKLTHAKTHWMWNDENQKIFDTVKSFLIDTVGYFNIKWITNVHSDASPVGLSGVLTQQNPKDTNEKKIIMCISRMLSEVEERYSQIEKEGLAPVWAVERLQLYLLGRKFYLYVDNKAISLIYNNPLANPPARIKRWQLRLSPFDFEVIHIPGSSNIADFLSRHPMVARKED